MKLKILISILLISANCLLVQAKDNQTDELIHIEKTWNMSNLEFEQLKTISEDTEIDGLTFKASKDKPIDFISSKQTLNGIEYSRCVSLGGIGSKNYRSIELDVFGVSTIKITAKSNSSEIRTLKFMDEYGNELGSMKCSSLLTRGTDITEETKKIYIYSNDSSISIYEIKLITDNI